MRLAVALTLGAGAGVASLLLSRRYWRGFLHWLFSRGDQ